MISSAQSPSQNAWWGFSNANDRQKIFAFIRRCIRTGFCCPDLADFHDLYISSDVKLFNKILTCPNHILRTLLPPPTAQNYSLRKRPHNRQLPDRLSGIMDCNFTVPECCTAICRLLAFIYFRPALCFILVYNCVLTVRNKRICYVMLCAQANALAASSWLGHVLDVDRRAPRIRRVHHARAAGDETRNAPFSCYRCKFK